MNAGLDEAKRGAAQEKRRFVQFDRSSKALAGLTPKRFAKPLFVVAGLVPAIHALFA